MSFPIPEKAYTTDDEDVSIDERNSFLQGLGAAKDNEVVHLDRVESIIKAKTFKQAPKSEVAASSAEQLVRFQEFHPVAQQVTTNVDAIAINTAKVGITTTQANNIVTNNAKVGITTEQTSQITQNKNDITPLKREIFYIGQESNDNVSVNTATTDNTTVSIKDNSVWAKFVKHDNIVTFDFQCFIKTTSPGNVNEVVLDISWDGDLNLPANNIPVNVDFNDGRENGRFYYENAILQKVSLTSCTLWIYIGTTLLENTDCLLRINGSFAL